ncbi:MAG TPA: hypothetical protein VG797_02020 [Phycisphaerales bacterium]|nr:hypothetical protein [Phycisphaerales bacterium]
MLQRRNLAILGIVLASSGATAFGASFMPLALGAEAAGGRMSADGSIVVGAVTSEAVGEYVAAIFFPDGSHQVIDPEHPSVAIGCTPDGSTIFGRRQSLPEFLPFYAPCMWTGNDHAPVDFDTSSAGFTIYGECRGISDDGASVALFRLGAVDATGFRGFTDGSVQSLEASDDSYAYGASPNGQLIAGVRIESAPGTYATIWNASTGEATDLHDASGAYSLGGPEAFSRDGQFLLGWALHTSTSTYHATRADLSGHIVPVWIPMSDARATGASLGARVIVGHDNDRGAIVWNASHGARLLRDVLIEEGIDMTGWDLDQAIDVSADGTRISGNGRFNHGPVIPFLATINPPPCEGDANADGIVSLRDIGRVIAHWGESGEAGGRGDANANGSVGIDDISHILAHWGETCGGN